MLESATTIAEQYPDTVARNYVDRRRKNVAEMLQLYEQSYQRALQELVIEQQGRHRRDEYMHGALRTPLQSQNP